MVRFAAWSAFAALLAPLVAGPARGEPATRGADPTKGAAMVTLYVGTSGKSSRGVWRVSFDPSDGTFGPPALAAGGVSNPSFVARHPALPVLYAVSETGGGGSVAALAIDAATGDLREIGRRPSGGAGPTHVSVSPSGAAVLVANYGGGSVASFPVGEGGTLGPAASVEQHAGTGPNAARQAGPHAHGITPDPSGRWAVACDLGTDRTYVYRLDPATAELTPADVPSVAAANPGAGPRHLAFSPDGRYCYVVNELDNTVEAFAFDAASGALSPVQTVSTLPHDLPADEASKSYAGEVAVALSGRFAYASNRIGHDSIAAFSRDAATGRLAFLADLPSGGGTPRHFALSPDGRWLVVANQVPGTVAAFAVDAESGTLTPGQAVEVPGASAVAFPPGG